MKIISNDAYAIACNVKLSSETKNPKIHLTTRHHDWQLISTQVVDFSTIRAILNRDGLILYQTKNKNNWKLLQGASDQPEFMQYTVKIAQIFYAKLILQFLEA